MISLCNSGSISNEEMHAQNQEHAFTKPLQFWQMSQSAFFPSKILCSYYLIGNRVRVKSSGMAPGFGECPVPGQHKICKCPTPGTDEAGKCPAVARGGAGRSWNWLMHKFDKPCNGNVNKVLLLLLTLHLPFLTDKIPFPILSIDKWYLSTYLVENFTSLFLML